MSIYRLDPRIINSMWEHLVVDNFLKQEHFDFVCEQFKFTSVDKVRKDIFQINNNQVHIEETSGLGNLTKEFILDMYTTYNSRLLSYLQILASEKVTSYRTTKISFSAYPKNYTYYTHNDSAQKLLSVIVYLQPKSNTGTLLYENQQDTIPSKTVEWEQNRALIFSRSNHTWHSFKSDNISDRYTLMFNLNSFVI